MGRACRALATALLLTALVAGTAGAAAPANDAFQQTWARTDQPVAALQTARSWLWGPEALTGPLREAYAGAPGGLRTVQYFDKSRMELNDPSGDPASPWYVTNGLLATELISGRMQVGANSFVPRAPAAINVAGDPNDPAGPTYATFTSLLGAAPAADGAPITRRLARDGTTRDDPALAGAGVTAAEHVRVTALDHQVASPFWAFMNSLGLVVQSGQATRGPLFPDAFYATGYPISEAYWTTVEVSGVARDVLVQCFQRRCLTYTPSNPAGWQVESGNVGQHYLQWRYGDPVLRQQNLKRATAAYQAMQQQEYQADVALYHELGSRDYAYHWPFSQASAATIDLAGLPDAGGSYLSDLQQRLTGLDHYWDATHQPPGLSSAVMPPLGPSGDLFYDDNAWTGLALVQAYRETGNPDLLERARRILQFDLSGWDNDASHPAPGGVFWVDAGWNRDRNTVSTAGTAKLALQLADVTSDPAQRAGYLAWGQKLTGWVEQTLRAPDGLYWDHIDLAGKIDKTEWSYNQGQMIGAYVLLYRLTGDQNDRQRAQAIANAALAFYVDGGRLDAQPPIFNAIFFENLQFLATVDANPRYTWEAQRYADWLWTTRRDPATNLFAGASEPGSSANDALLDQAAVIQLYARLAWDPGSYGLSR